MTRSQFSNKSLIERFGSEATFSEVVAELESDVEMLGEVICGVELNGAKLNEADEKGIETLSVQEIQSLAIVTGKPFHLAQGIIENWVETLPRLIQSSETIASNIRFEGAQSSGQALSDLFDACQFFVDSLSLLKGQFIKTPQFSRIGERWELAESHLSKTISDIFVNIDSGNYNAVSDVLEYDLCSGLEEWLKVIGEVNKVYFPEVSELADALPVDEPLK